MQNRIGIICYFFRTFSELLVFTSQNSYELKEVGLLQLAEGL